MTLPQDPMGLWEEIRVAELATKAQLTSWDGLVGGLVGPFFEGSHEAGNNRYDPENHAYELVRFMLGQLVWNNPRVRLKTRVFGADRKATMMEHAINQWSQDRYYGEFLLGPTADSLFGYGCTLTTRELHPFLKLKDKSPAMTVGKSRLSPHRCVFDPLAVDRDDERFRGHFWVQDQDAAVKHARAERKKQEAGDSRAEHGWNPGVIAGLSPGTDTERLHRPKRWKDRVNRDELVFCDVWVPEWELGDQDDGYNGAIATLAVGTGDGGETHADFAREPQPYFGPAFGPYTRFDIFPVPDRAQRLAPLVATAAQVDDWNRHARGVSASAARYKRLVLVDANNPDLEAQIRDEEHDEVIPVYGLERDQVLPLEVGGISEQNLAYLQVAKERVERVSGMSDAQRGQVQGSATATESAIAAASGDIGTEFMKLQIQRAVRRDLLGVAWYIAYDDEFRQALGRDAAPLLGIEPPPNGEPLTIEGGPDDDPETPDIPFEELSLELEPMSMERTTSASNQRRAMEAFTATTSLAQAKMMIPGFDADGMATLLGEAMNMPDLGDYISAVPVAGTDEAAQAVAAGGAQEFGQAAAGNLGVGSRSNGSSRGTYEASRDLIGRSAGRMASTDVSGTTGQGAG